MADVAAVYNGPVMTDSQAHRSGTVAAKPEIRNRTDPVFLRASRRKKDLSSVSRKMLLARP